MRVLRALLVGMVALIAACSIGRPIPAIATYNIELTPPQGGTTRLPHSERLQVARVHVAAPYDRASLVYRVSAVRYTSDPYHAFLSEPGPMLGDRISEWLGNSGLFKAVDAPGSGAPAPLVLEARVTELYGDFAQSGNPAAVMSVHFTLLDEQEVRSKVTFEGSFSQRVSISSSSPEALVRGYGSALADILTQFTTNLAASAAQ